MTTNGPTAGGRKKRNSHDHVRSFIFNNIEHHSADIVARIVEEFQISRQAAARHLQKLVAEGVLVAAGHTKSRSYRLALALDWHRSYALSQSLEEHAVWETDISPLLSDLPKDTREIWQISFTEMFNNAIDHSNGSQISVSLFRTAAGVQVILHDDGVGIFRKIQREMGLADENHAILELSKGKLTTDPSKHTGEGIFFTSRMLDLYAVASSGKVFSHSCEAESDFLTDHIENGDSAGTTVFMKLKTNCMRTASSVFKAFSSSGGYDFAKTVIPVVLARHGNEALVSRSQAKRLLSRVDLFQTVMLDFDGVEAIGQAFADEIFRVFVKAHPEVLLIPRNASPEVSSMIEAALSGWSYPVNPGSTVKAGAV